ncbi:hypothetical protein [uncultured Thiodictyon sp.]|uniref:hypothetical protein n=1 Tax=uncultured Thiodictyon sp. TaxID=1846217 RepID=UPI0025D6EED4|nr:hypothetical protein [uncultured Thiodictyon sp.]
MKLLQLRLASVRYDGDNIGNDITIDVQAGSAFFSLNKSLDAGASASIGKIVAEFTAVSNPSVIPIVASVTERDPVFNDSGRSAGEFSVPLGAAVLQTFHLAIPVEEKGAVRSAGTALFTLEFTAELAEAIRYLPPSSDGFTVVLEEPSRKRISLPTALAVQVERIAGGREYFVIREGSLKGKRASVSLGSDKHSRLAAENPQTPPIQLVFSLSKKELSTEDGRSTYAAVSDVAPVSPGLYDLEIPDAPHVGGLNYPDAPHARTWFRIGHQGRSYLHPGAMSLGCVTVTETARWEELYHLLIVARKGDGISVGVLRVVE